MDKLRGRAAILATIFATKSPPSRRHHTLLIQTFPIAPENHRFGLGLALIVGLPTCPLYGKQRSCQKCHWDGRNVPIVLQKSVEVLCEQ